MNVLFLVQREQRVILDRLYEAVAAHCNCDLRWLGREEQADLRRYFHQQVDVARYDRIVFFLRFKQEIRQVAFIRSVPNLVILEHDACQNYMPGKYQGRFSEHYRRLPWARVLNSGYALSERLRQEGVDSVFVPKGYDQAVLRNLGHGRDIELGFVGSLKSDVYSERRALLESLAQTEHLRMLKSAPGEAYCELLNHIRFFVSADVGLGEYMIKNFEAMACGCVLLAYDQGEAENRALGFIDMDTVVLYRTVEELREKLQLLRQDPALAERIAANGQRLAERDFSFAHIGQRIAEALLAPLRVQPAQSWWHHLRLRLGV
ncbi:Glycosyl transferases group 1 [Pseudomonas benzenivorans]|nr:glycosyltransferase [Pseudomonas benzenivorans]SDG58643.1 Glycosyl transferases group 1 [Pseudomonas benzenivorans]